jgi:periplasmic protein TonB
MASPAQITEQLPQTLPGDFVEWDEASRSPQPVRSCNGEHGPGVGVVSDPSTQAAEAPCAAAPSGNLPSGAALPFSAHGRTGGAAAPYPSRSLSPPSPVSSDIVGQFHAGVPAIDKLRSSAPRPDGAPAAVTMTGLHKIPLPSLLTNTVEITRVARMKWPIIAGASAALAVILAAMIPTFDRGSVPSAKSDAAPEPTMGAIQLPEDAAPTRARSTVTVPKSTAAATPAGEAQIRSEATPQPAQKNAKLSRESAAMMDDQLHAPSRLGIRAALAEQASLPPGGLVAAEMPGLDISNPIGAVFGSPKQPGVQVGSQQVIKPKDPREQIESQKAISVSPSVALGLLIQKTQPVYSLFAKTAHVSGTVALAAAISKTGDVQSLRVLSGPVALRESALDAVRTWRFKPYMLNNQPTPIETTINLHFSLN